MTDKTETPAFDLADLDRLTKDQDEGHEFEFSHPVTGTPTGIFITVCGPDSRRAHRARQELEAEISRWTTRASTSGRMPPQDRERAVEDFLFAVTLAWRVRENGKELVLDRHSFGRLLRAGTWIKAQLDSFAGDREPYFQKGGE